jgi:hypothetical protein
VTFTYKGRLYSRPMPFEALFSFKIIQILQMSVSSYSHTPFTSSKDSRTFAKRFIIEFFTNHKQSILNTLIQTKNCFEPIAFPHKTVHFFDALLPDRRKFDRKFIWLKEFPKKIFLPANTAQFFSFQMSNIQKIFLFFCNSMSSLTKTFPLMTAEATRLEGCKSKIEL